MIDVHGVHVPVYITRVVPLRYRRRVDGQLVPLLYARVGEMVLVHPMRWGQFRHVCDCLPMLASVDVADTRKAT